MVCASYLQSRFPGSSQDVLLTGLHWSHNDSFWQHHRYIWMRVREQHEKLLSF
ncbi:MAG: hypothetical protein QOE55_3857 [Acidobacteriaceae bacterium]|nr:hypothetical protein [Acidobacteriaceae bacterium]